jgi:hypothetical protein
MHLEEPFLFYHKAECVLAGGDYEAMMMTTISGYDYETAHAPPTLDQLRELEATVVGPPPAARIFTIAGECWPAGRR